MTRVLVTGGGGFVGQWLVRALLRRDNEIWVAGVTTQPASSVLDQPDAKRVRWLECDVRDAAAVNAVVAEARPEQIFHLAAMSLIPQAEREPEAARRVNVDGAVNIGLSAAALTEQGDDPVLLVIGSGTQYGHHDRSEMPLTETAEQRPVSVYAATKREQEV